MFIAMNRFKVTPGQEDAFERIWRFVAAHMVAPAGEWRTLLARDGQVIDGRLGNPWKVAYHTGRSMLECAARLDALLSARALLSP